MFDLIEQLEMKERQEEATVREPKGGKEKEAEREKRLRNT